MKGAQDFIALFKKNNKNINMKKFIQLKVRSSIKTKKKQKLLRTGRVHLLLNTSLFTLKYF